MGWHQAGDDLTAPAVGLLLTLNPPNWLNPTFGAALTQRTTLHLF